MDEKITVGGYQQKPKVDIKMGQGKDKDAISIELTYYCDDGDLVKFCEMAIWMHKKLVDNAVSQGYKVVPHQL